MDRIPHSPLLKLSRQAVVLLPPKPKKVVLRIGGSVLGSPPDAKLVEGYASVISEATKGPYSLGVVVGGGPVSRLYIGIAKQLHLPPKDQDTIAIQASRLNARLVGMKLGLPHVSVTIKEMVTRLSKKGVGVMGGLRPGITTDTVAALLAEAWHADLLVKASDQDGIYTSDPRTNKDAKLLQTLSYQGLSEILGGEHRPGIHSIVDPVAVKLIVKHRMKLIVTNGFDEKNVLRAIRGQRVGTLVS